MSNAPYVSIPVSPMGKPRMTQRDKWDKRDVVIRYWEYKAGLRKHLPAFTLPQKLQVTFYLPMPLSWSKGKRQAMVGAPHDSTPDIDNLCKAFMDAFIDKDAGLDDKHVAELHAYKFWSDEGSIDVETVPDPADWSGDDMWPEAGDPQGVRA